jgi:3,4-dihydroxy 2-butanone 4-phosphate synthase/GTP cyclohydrolase II
MAGTDLDRLGIPVMVEDNEDVNGTAFTVSVDAAAGITTGVSSRDRVATIRALADPLSGPGDLRRPGHVFPLRESDGGLPARQGHTEATVALCRLAGIDPAVGVIGELVNDDGTMMRLGDLRRFADEHGLKLVSVEQLAAETTVAGKVV